MEQANEKFLDARGVGVSVKHVVVEGCGIEMPLYSTIEQEVYAPIRAFVYIGSVALYRCLRYNLGRLICKT